MNSQLSVPMPSLLSAIALRRRSLLRMQIGTQPQLFYKIYGASALTRALRVRPNTGLVIEGFPRSANTFAVLAFEQAQGTPVRIAHHLHVPAQVQCGVRLRIPTLLLLREPIAAAISLVVREPWRSLRGTLREYVLFHQAILRLPRGSFVLGEFERVTTAFGGVIEEVNMRFNRRFSIFDHDESNVARVFESAEALERVDGGVLEHAVARPSNSRTATKKRLLRQIDESRLGALREQAEVLYYRILDENPHLAESDCINP